MVVANDRWCLSLPRTPFSRNQCCRIKLKMTHGIRVDIGHRQPSADLMFSPKQQATSFPVRRQARVSDYLCQHGS